MGTFYGNLSDQGLTGRSGLQTEDIDGKARNYAQVLVALNGGQKAIDLFVRKNSVLESRADFGDPKACLP